MKKIRVGVVGYGNLGKAVEELIYNDERFRLVCIFSRREVCGKYANVDKVENLKQYKGKIDVVFLCGGSSSNLKEQAYECLKYFCTVDAYDNHKQIKKYISNCNKLARINNRVAFCSVGWDPGVFSLMRVLFKSICGNVYTTWGKGISQGHSEAVRKINHVKDAVQYTIPNKRIIHKIKCGQNVDNLKTIHTRKCYVVADKMYQGDIKKQIVKMPNYFSGYKTKVKFVKEESFKRLKFLYHSGEVFGVGENLSFKLKTNSNPKTTAKIMIAYCIVLYEYFKYKQYGAYSILDIPLSKLIKNSKKFI